MDSAPETRVTPSSGGGEVYPRDMADLVRPLYSKSQIEKAGKVLRRRDLQPNELDEHYGLTTEEAFAIAHNWRSAHVVPLLRVRQDVSAKCRAFETGALTAARLKRMQAIRRKLQRPFTLYQIQDIAGCRAILADMAEVQKMVALYRNGGSRHTVQKEDDYIVSPKPDGYRSHHLILNFRGQGDLEIYNRQTVELQLRSRLQHVWATAVEAVGLIRHENLKNGKGDADWLRLFQLMSAEFSEHELGGPVPGTPASAEERRQEIRDLALKLNAATILDSYRVAIDLTEEWYVRSGLDRYFLLQFDYATRQVSVEPFSEYAIGSDRYIEEEMHNQSRNTVLVEVDAVTDLKRAFPNYFLDVTVFNERLDEVIHGRPLAHNAAPLTQAADAGEEPTRRNWEFLKNWSLWKSKGKNKPRL